jgi:N-acetylglucosaminyldiphosphoundecaprenol N-acetyl-beta-D-mannosaminyltransferase
LLNVHMLIEAYRNKDFVEILNNAEIVAPDGVSILWAFKLIHGIRQDRVAEMDLLPDSITGAALEKIPVIVLWRYRRTTIQNKRVFKQKIS